MEALRPSPLIKNKENLTRFQFYYKFVILFQEEGSQIVAAAFEGSCIAVETAALRTQTDRYGLSLGDRACLSHALSRGLPVLTADKEWKKLDLPLDSRLIR